METTCGSLLSELQKIWDEVGEPSKERDRMILELEKECLDLYRRKVDQASQCRAQLRQAVADCEAELASMCAALGERPVHIRQNSGSLRKELQAIMPQLEGMRRKQIERKSQFAEVLEQIHSISNELFGSSKCITVIDETDLSMKRLEDLQCQLLSLQKEKSDRVKHLLDLLNTINSLCLVLGMDFKLTIREVDATLDDPCDTKNISLDTFEKLSAIIHQLKDVKIQRMQKLQDLATTMVELWTLMDTPNEEQQRFQNVIRYIAASEDEIIDPETLSLELISHAEAEVVRLQEMKFSKMKEVLLKKRLVLEEICRGAHMVVQEHDSLDLSVESIESGAIDPLYMLEQLEIQISKDKEEAFSRKEIIEKIQKWLAACDEECWLEEYNRDDNRYNAGRGTHLMLKRAEKARILVNKIPAMVETLSSKAKAWEKERGQEFLYDGVALRSMLEQYCILKNEKEQERLRQRDQKKLQGQLITEQEALFGSKPSPTKSGKKNYRPSLGGLSNKRYSLGGAMLQNAFPEKTTHSSRSLWKSNPLKQQNSHGGLTALSGKKNTSKSNLSKQHSRNATNGDDNGSSMSRKPLSPINFLLLSNISSTNIQDHNKKSVDLRETHSICKTPVAAPIKNIAAFEENRTPKVMPNPMPATPPTVTISMQTAMTPATPCIPHDIEYVEYSFEEKRAGFTLPKSHLRSLPLL